MKFGATELARRAQVPRHFDVAGLRALAVYLTLHHCHAVLAEPIARIDAFCDADRMGCEETRGSASGLLVLVGGEPVLSTSQTQLGP